MTMKVVNGFLGAFHLIKFAFSVIFEISNLKQRNEALYFNMLYSSLIAM